MDYLARLVSTGNSEWPDSWRFPTADSVADMYLDRRRFLALSGLALAGCGAGGGSSGDVQAPPGGYSIGRRFPSTVLVPGKVRLPISLQANGESVRQGPARLTGKMVDDQGNVVMDSLVAVRRGAGLAIPFWAFEAEVAAPGFYTLQVDDGPADGLGVQINDPAQVAVPLVGQPLPPFATPTVGDGRGVDPICTRDPMCPLHELTLTEALATGKPVAYLIGTPAYCQTGVCGPVLDFLLAARDKVGDKIAMVHADIYTYSSIKTVSPAVLAYQMDYEPALFIADASGKVVERLDAVWDADELDTALQLVTN